MADKGIKVADSATGESVACVDARNQDDGGNARVLQLAAGCTSPGNLAALRNGTALRTVTFSSSRGDTLDLDDFTGDGANDLLDVSDAESFVVYCRVDPDDCAQGLEFWVVPLAHVTDGESRRVCFALPPWLPRAITWDTTADNDEETNMLHADFSGEGQTKYITTAMVFPTLGAEYMGFHVRSENAIDCQVDVFAYALQGAAPSGVAALYHNFYVEGDNAYRYQFPGGDSAPMP